jgi:glycosyltransferase involved in cell wall biosynthesis
MPETAKLRVLTLSKPYVAAAYREKFRLLNRDPRFALGVITPPAWGSQAFESHPDDRYWLKQVPILLNGRNHFHVYSGLKSAVQEFAPQIFNCEEEHYSLVTYQCFRLAVQHKIKPIFYTWQNIAKAYPPPFAWIEQYVFRHAAAAIAGNQEAANILYDKGFRGRIEVMPQMGTDLTTFSTCDPTSDQARSIRRELKIREDAFLVFYAGRLVPEKGLIDLLEAMHALRDLGRIQALILGDGPEKDRLQSRIHELNLGERVTLRSGVLSLEIVPYFQAADVLCLPSLTRPNWKEQFGRVLTEAMATGTVPVGSDSGEIPRVIADAGRVFPEGHPQALANILRDLYERPEDMKVLRHKARLRVEERYSQDKIAERFGQLFLDLA